MVLKIKKSSLIESILIFAVLFLVFLYDACSSLLGFFDEFLGLLSFFVIIYQIIIKQRFRLFRKEYFIILSLILIIFIGFLSNAYTCYKGYCTNAVAIFADAINVSKAFVVYFAIRFLSDSMSSSSVLDKITSYSLKAFYILVFIIVLDIAFEIFPRENRFGIQSIELFFKHTSRYAFAFSFIFLLLLSKYQKQRLGLLFFVLFIGALSLRVKYFGFVFFVIILLFQGKKLIRTPKPVFLWSIALLLTVLAFLFREKITLYFSFENIDEAWSRAVILYYSFIVGFDYFPLGTGFGTFSSYYSGAYYSWVYDLYGISNVYGIKRSYWNFVADQYWPMVLGQFGYIGLISMFFIVYNYLMLFLNNVKSNIANTSYFTHLSLILGLLLLLIDSTSDSIFSQQRAVVMFAYFALVMNTVNSRESITNK